METQFPPDAGGASGTVNQAVVPPCALRSMPATPPKKAALVATEETVEKENRAGISA